MAGPLTVPTLAVFVGAAAIAVSRADPACTFYCDVQFPAPAMSSFFYDQNTGCAEACEDSLDFSHDPRVAPGPESWRLMGYPTACNESCAEACVDEFSTSLETTLDERGGCRSSCRQAFWVDLAAFSKGVEDETQRSCEALSEINDDAEQQRQRLEDTEAKLDNKIRFSKSIEKQLNKRITKMVKRRIKMFNNAMLDLDALNERLAKSERECEWTEERIARLEHRVFPTTTSTTTTRTATTTTATTRDRRR